MLLSFDHPGRLLRVDNTSTLVSTCDDSKGHQNAISLDIGWMQNIGIIAENETYQRFRETAADMRRVSSEELLVIMDICCSPASAKTAGLVADSQLLIGAMTPEDQIMSGFKIPNVTTASFRRLHTEDWCVAGK
jgi:hypothetical protein